MHRQLSIWIMRLLWAQNGPCQSHTGQVKTERQRTQLTAMVSGAMPRGNEAIDAYGAVLHDVAKLGKYGWVGMNDLSASCELQLTRLRSGRQQSPQAGCESVMATVHPAGNTGQCLRSAGNGSRQRSRRRATNSSR